jgi:hypothetical protein
MEDVMKYISALLISFLITLSAHSQSCLPEGIIFLTQSQIDNFQVNYPNCTEIEGNITIGEWEVESDITNLDGLGVLNTIGGDFNIYYNDSLASLAGLLNLTSIGGSFNIFGNGSLTSLTGLDNLYYIGGNFGLAWQGNLSTFSHLNSLTSIGGSLYIDDNYILTSLTGLSSLNSIGNKLTITNNHALSSLSGLDSINSGSIIDLLIAANLLLSDCAVKSICDYLTSPNAIVKIEFNATGCDSQEEVEAACGVGVGQLDGWAVGQLDMKIYPNPAGDIVHFTFWISQYQWVTLMIYDIYGRKIATVFDERMLAGEQDVLFDISAFSEGVYFAGMITYNAVASGKIVKQ